MAWNLGFLGMIKASKPFAATAKESTISCEFEVSRLLHAGGRIQTCRCTCASCVGVAMQTPHQTWLGEGVESTF
eukprot:8047266-Alexandrium_andersonii.AAC.1